LLAPASVFCSDWSGNLNFFLGKKYLDGGDWGPVDEHDEIGILSDFKHKSWPVSIAFNALSSKDDVSGSVNLDAKTMELDIGVRKIWENFSYLRPHIGGGITFVEAEKKRMDEDSLGIWIGGGVYWTFDEHFNLGFDLRWSDADVTLFGIDTEAGGFHASLLVGLHW